VSGYCESSPFFPLPLEAKRPHSTANIQLAQRLHGAREGEISCRCQRRWQPSSRCVPYAGRHTLMIIRKGSLYGVLGSVVLLAQTPRGTRKAKAPPPDGYYRGRGRGRGSNAGPGLGPQPRASRGATRCGKPWGRGTPTAALPRSTSRRRAARRRRKGRGYQSCLRQYSGEWVRCKVHKPHGKAPPCGSLTLLEAKVGKVAPQGRVVLLDVGLGACTAGGRQSTVVRACCCTAERTAKPCFERSGDCHCTLLPGMRLSGMVVCRSQG
jgi:hypothetical protein